MRLLVSVRGAGEALDAVAGGADIVDAKEPSRGAMGAVGRAALIAIARAVDGARPLSAALGDGLSPAAAARRARDAARVGAAFIKIGFAGTTADDARQALSAAVRATAVPGRVEAGRCGVVAVGYADAALAAAPSIDVVLELAEQTGARGVLLDTANKRGAALLELLTLEHLRAIAARAHAAGLWLAVAGRLEGADLVTARRAGADIAGVRGAACDGGRTGRISCERVAALAALAHPGHGAPSASARPAASVMATAT